MPRHISTDRRLTRECHLRYSAADYDSLIQDARAAGLSVSEYVRRRSLGRPVLAQTDMAICRELARLGGLLKHLYTQSGRDKTFGQLSRTVLADISKTIECIAQGHL